MNMQGGGKGDLKLWQVMALSYVERGIGCLKRWYQLTKVQSITHQKTTFCCGLFCDPQ